MLDASEEAQTAAINNFSKRYAEIFSSAVAVDLFYCSAAVSLPPGINIDLNQILADSGYIHSAGYAIYIRNIKKARSHDFKYNLKRRVKGIAPSEPIPLIVYAHEDFTPYDDFAKDQISRGIETTKLSIEKMSMGAVRLSEIITSLKTEIPQLKIPRPGSFEEHQNFNSERSFWLIYERSLAKSNPSNLGQERYYVCYEQLVKNENPFFLFDEDKPAWKSHTTLPHSLTAALINITRPQTENTVLYDPFGGSGTTWLEAKRLSMPSTVYTSDNSPISFSMHQDNLQFFLDSADNLKKIKTNLEAIGENLDFRKISNTSSYTQRVLPLNGFETDISKAFRLLEQLANEQPHEDQEYCFSEDIVRQIRSLETLSKHIFYIGLKAKFRYQGGYKRGSTNFGRAFSNSLKQFLKKIEQLISLKQMVESGISSSRDNFSVFQGRYSKGVISSFFLKSADLFKSEIQSNVKQKDARNLEVESIDVIISDPPYGVNTTENQDDLANLYSEFIYSAIKALKFQGHLIICLPEESYTGRNLPYCTQSDIITNQVLVKANRLNRDIYVPAKSLPIKGFTPPYYWEAERALRRTILHFRIL